MTFLHFVGTIMLVFLVLFVAGAFLAIYNPVLERIIVFWTQVIMSAAALVMYVALCIWLIVH